jgi:hypothetical protein
MHSILTLLLLLAPLPSAAGAICPCWTTEELRSTVAATPDDPMAGEDAAVDRCELSVTPLGARLSARLSFQNLEGDRFQGAIVEFNPTDQECRIFDDGLGLALVPITVVDLSEEEASACARNVGEICSEILPEPSSSALLGAGVAMLALLAKGRGAHQSARSRPV